MLSFAVYGKLLLDATKEADEEFINLLMGSIVYPLDLTDKTDEAILALDKGTISRYLKGGREIHQKIVRGSRKKKVIDGANDYFDKNIVKKINPALVHDLISKLSKAISFDATIAEKKKAELLSLADENTLADFLAKVFLYVINKPNVVIEKITTDNNLPPRNQFFAGRADELNNINSLFKKKGNNAVNICQTVSGLGGIGKSQLAIEYAYRFGSIYRNLIWFINAETATTTQNDFFAFANHFNLPLSPDFMPEELQTAIKTWLGNQTDWLLIFDNLEFVDVVSPYLPNKINGRIIITTRNTRIDFGSQLTLGVFDMDEALAFIRKRLSKDEELLLEFYKKDENDFDTVAPKLIERLGFLPLALEQAAAYIKEVKCSITTYLQLLDEYGLASMAEKQALPEHYDKASDYEKIVTATWEISFKAITLEGAKQLLNLCAYMAPDRIPVSFFVEMREKLPSPIKEDMADKIATLRVVTELRTYSLTSGNADYINVHRLVQEVVRKKHTS